MDSLKLKAGGVNLQSVTHWDILEDPGKPGREPRKYRAPDPRNPLDRGDQEDPGEPAEPGGTRVHVWLMASESGVSVAKKTRTYGGRMVAQLEQAVLVLTGDDAARFLAAVDASEVEV